MPVSPSTIAFALVTCIPFGLAIRDTVEHRQPTTPDRHSDELDAENAREERLRAEQAVRDAEREAEIEHHKLMLIDLIGPGPAQLGRSFDGITLGMTAADFEHKRDLIADLRTQTAATIRAGASWRSARAAARMVEPVASPSSTRMTTRSRTAGGGALPR